MFDRDYLQTVFITYYKTTLFRRNLKLNISSQQVLKYSKSSKFNDRPFYKKKKTKTFIFVSYDFLCNYYLVDITCTR